MRAAVRAVKAAAPRRVVVAVPVAAASSCRELAREADEVVCLEQPEPFTAVGEWYMDFAQTTDDEVHDLLRAPSARRTPGEAARK
jgi:predicted phosphoribosyltransferase